MKFTILVISFIISSLGYSQLPKNAIHFEGNWKYEGGSGEENWYLQDGVLKGESFRFNKVGDETKAEEFEIKSVNGVMVYTLKTFNVVDDSLVKSNYTFIGEKRKYKFIAMDNSTLYSMTYKIHWWNRKKMVIIFHYTATDKGVKIKLGKEEPKHLAD